MKKDNKEILLPGDIWKVIGLFTLNTFIARGSYKTFLNLAQTCKSVNLALNQPDIWKIVFERLIHELCIKYTNGDFYKLQGPVPDYKTYVTTIISNNYRAIKHKDIMTYPSDPYIADFERLLVQDKNNPLINYLILELFYFRRNGDKELTFYVEASQSLINAMFLVNPEALSSRQYLKKFNFPENIHLDWYWYKLLALNPNKTIEFLNIAGQDTVFEKPDISILYDLIMNIAKILKYFNIDQITSVFKYDDDEHNRIKHLISLNEEDLKSLNECYQQLCQSPKQKNDKTQKKLLDKIFTAAIKLYKHEIYPKILENRRFFSNTSFYELSCHPELLTWIVNNFAFLKSTPNISGSILAKLISVKKELIINHTTSFKTWSQDTLKKFTKLPHAKALKVFNPLVDGHEYLADLKFSKILDYLSLPYERSNIADNKNLSLEDIIKGAFPSEHQNPKKRLLTVTVKSNPQSSSFMEEKCPGQETKEETKSFFSHYNHSLFQRVKSSSTTTFVEPMEISTTHTNEIALDNSHDDKVVDIHCSKKARN